MGISLTNKDVEVNSTDQNGVSIHWRDNPHYRKFCDFEIISVFGRKKLRDQMKGDANPLVHALKGNRDFIVDDSSLFKVRYHAARIVKNIIDNKPPDLLVTLPSSSQLNAYFSNYLKRKSNARLLDGAFRKSTLADIIANKLPSDSIQRSRKAEYTSALTRIENGKPGNLIKLKEIPLKIRQYFTPISIDNAVFARLMGTQQERIFVIDDVVASGTTILCGLKKVKELFPLSDVVGVTVFSDLKAKKLDFH